MRIFEQSRREGNRNESLSSCHSAGAALRTSTPSRQIRACWGPRACGSDEEFLFSRFRHDYAVRRVAPSAKSCPDTPRFVDTFLLKMKHQRLEGQGSSARP